MVDNEFVICSYAFKAALGYREMIRYTPWSKPEGLEGRLSSWSEATKTIGTRFNKYLI